MAELKTIARVHSAFPTKFGIPRQSGLVESLRATLVFEPEYRSPEALRGLEDFSHLWLIWGFSGARREEWRPTVRPPRLGGNTRLGVFATRSPFRPNALGLSCVRLAGVEKGGPTSPVLHLRGADLMDDTPVYDIKPYLPYADCHPEAVGGFAAEAPTERLEVNIPQPWLDLLPPEERSSLHDVLAQDPRPPYQQDPARVYSLEYGGFEVRFCVAGEHLIVVEIKAR